MIYNNGEIYKGNWKKDKREREGIMNYLKNEIYGEWKNDMKNGKDKIYYNNNQLFICEFKNDKREEEGIIEFKNNEDCVILKFKVIK